MNGCARTQRPDGSWHTYYRAKAQVEEPRLDTNVCAYVATGVWHYFLVTRDSGFLEDLWPSVERAIDFCRQLAAAWRRARVVGRPRRDTGELRAADRFLLGVLQPTLRHRVRLQAGPGAPRLGARGRPSAPRGC